MLPCPKERTGICALVERAPLLDDPQERLLVAVAVVVSLISKSSVARRRRRMIWSIGATSFGQTSTHWKQCVQS